MGRVARASVCVAIRDHVHLRHRRSVTREGDTKMLDNAQEVSDPGTLWTTSYSSSSHTIHDLDQLTVAV